MCHHWVWFTERARSGKGASGGIPGAQTGWQDRRLGNRQTIKSAFRQGLFFLFTELDPVGWKDPVPSTGGIPISA